MVLIGFQKRALSSDLIWFEPLNQNIRPFYSLTGLNSHLLRIRYKFEVQAKSLGMWATISIQQSLLDRRKRTGVIDHPEYGLMIYPVKYFDESGNIVNISSDLVQNEEYASLYRYYHDYEFYQEDIPQHWQIDLRVSKSLWQGAEFSFFVNNLFNHRPFYKKKATSPLNPSYTQLNSQLYFGVEISATVF